MEKEVLQIKDIDSEYEQFLNSDEDPFNEKLSLTLFSKNKNARKMNARQAQHVARKLIENSAKRQPVKPRGTTYLIDDKEECADQIKLLHDDTIFPMNYIWRPTCINLTKVHL